MAVERLDFVLRRGHVFDEGHDAIRSLEWFAVPSQSRGGPVELGELAETRRRVICGVVNTGEVVRCSGGNLNTRET